MTDLAFRFNWHELPESDMVKYAFISLVSDGINKPTGDRIFDQVTDATDGAKDCVMRVFINDIEVSARGFMDSLDRNFDLGVARRADEVLKEIGLDELQSAVDSAQRAARRVLRERLKEIGLEIMEYD